MKNNVKNCRLGMSALFVLALAFVVPGGAAWAQGDVVVTAADDSAVIAPYMPEDNTHPDLRLTPDKSTLVRLPHDIKTVFVGNPAHLSVLAESPDLLVLVGKAPGATYFTALDGDGNVVMQRHVIVASPKEGYVRIRRSCINAGGGEDSGGGGGECQSTSVYYCPDMCHEVIIPAAEETGGADAASGTTGDVPDGE